MQHNIRVSAIQRLCLQDGPGVRTTVFLKGCYLSCPWCCNPETIYFDDTTFFCKDSSSQCGKLSFCQSCDVFQGHRKRENCPLGVYKKTSTDYDIDELYSLLLRDNTLYQQGGGVTFSGGEPLMQAEVLYPLLKKLHEDGIHIALESSLYAPVEKFQKIVSLVDYWLVDVKFQFGFISYLEQNKYIHDFAANLSEVQRECKSKHIVRMVISKQAIPKVDDILDRFSRYGIKTIELLPCHQLAENKYLQLGRKPPVYCAPEKEELSKFVEKLKVNNIKVNILKL